MTTKKYLARRDLPIFVFDIEVKKKYVLEEFAKDDELFLRRLVNARKLFYALDTSDARYDLVELPRSRRQREVQTIPAGILAQLLRFADAPAIPPILGAEEAEAILASVPEFYSTFFQRKTPAQLIAERNHERRMVAKQVDEESLLQLRIWLAEHYEYISTMRQ